MNSLWKQLRQRWDDWCGDREMEMAIRRHLSEQGYFGTTAKFRGVRLVAVERPGWVQVFRFEATARVNPGTDDEGIDPDATYDELYGLVKDDARHKLSSVRVFTNPVDRQELFGRWSEGLICLRGAKGLLSTASQSG